jgi:4-carboxymuconolactone decarboxylase
MVVARISASPQELRGQLPDELWARLRNFRGKDLALFATLAWHPELLRSWSRFGEQLLARGRLPVKDRELLILRTAYRCHAPYEWAQHVESAREAGLSETDIAAARGAGHAADAWTGTLLRAADELCSDHKLSDETFRRLAENYREPDLIEACFLVGQYMMLAGVIASLGIELESA